MRDYTRQLSAAGIRVSLFIDPTETSLSAAVEAGAPVVELHTGRYADAIGQAARQSELARIRDAAEIGVQGAWWSTPATA